jgi:hypothetical protein
MIIGFCIIVVIAIFLTSIWYATRIDSLQIEQVQVMGGKTIPPMLIEEKVTTALSGTYFGLIPKRFAWLYPKGAIVEHIKTFDRVKNVRIEMSDTQTLSIFFDEYIPVALWCEDVEMDACLFIDDAGYAFAQAPVLEGSAFVRYIERDHIPKIDTYSFSESFMDETKTFMELLHDKISLYVTHVVKIGTYDIEYAISGGGVLKISQSIPMQESFNNLQTVLGSEEFKNIQPGSFQYIDLRFGDKVFVNEEKPFEDGATTTASSSSLNIE